MKKFLLSLISILAILTLFARFKMNSAKPDKLNVLIDEIEAKIAFRDAQNLEVSKVAVAWHLAHALKTINNICDTVLISKPENFKSTFNIPKVFVLTFGVIPRGKAKAPESVRPPENILTEDIRSDLVLVRQKLNSIVQLDKKAHFKHPMFYQLNKPQTFRFLEVHTNHHLKIVRDILK